MTSTLRLAGTLRDRTAEHLADLILSGAWAPGQYLPPEGELVQRLGVSRMAFREAMSRLEAQGLVEVRHGVGTRVADRTREAVAGSLSLMLRRSNHAEADLLEARRILETEAAALAAERATPHDLQTLSTALDAMRRPDTTPDEYTAGDLRFHLALARTSHNAVLEALADSLRSALHESIAATFQVDGRTERRLRGHEQILEAIRLRDPQRARRAVATHLAATEDNLRRLGRLGHPSPDDSPHRDESRDRPTAPLPVRGQGEASAGASGRRRGTVRAQRAARGRAVKSDEER